MISVIIPNYNGKNILEDCLLHLQDAVESCGFPVEVIVVDDCSSDGSSEIAQKFRWVRLILNEQNLGFGRTCNKGVEQAKWEIVYLLNNDVLVAKDFLKGIPGFFRDEKVFAVSSHAHDEDGAIVSGRYCPGFVSGFLKGVVAEACEEGGPKITLYASGGAAAFDKNKFLAMGGFDPLYHPFYWEDFDLGYRAWKRGWCVVYYPESRVLHKKHGVIRSLHKEKLIGHINRTNQLVCNWKNLTDAGYYWAHIGTLAIKTLLKLLTLRQGIAKNIREALAKEKMILDSKKREKPFIERTDAELFGIFREYLSYSDFAAGCQLKGNKAGI